MNFLQAIRTYDERKSLEIYAKKIQRKTEDFQFDDWELANRETEACFVRSRGGSKTNDFVDWLIWRIIRYKERWGWFTAKSGQLDQALFYCRKNPAVNYIKGYQGSAKYDIVLHTGLAARFGIVSTSNLGLRLDGIVIDEEEDMSAKQSTNVYPQMAGMLSTSPIHKFMHLGTLWINTIFNENAKVLPLSKRPWQECPWLVNSGFVQSEYDKGIVPQWTLDLLYECKETMPGGVVFPNVIEFSGQPPICERHTIRQGVDFNAVPHNTLVRIGEFNGCTWILKEEAFQYKFDDEELQARCLEYPTEVETGGWNDTFAPRLTGVDGSPFTTSIKAERVGLLLKQPLMVNKQLTPKTYKGLGSCVWLDNGTIDTSKLHFVAALFHAKHPIGFVDTPKQSEFGPRRPKYG